MTWDCPYMQGPDPYCVKLDKRCEPVQKGCVLYGKVRRAHGPEAAETKMMPTVQEDPRIVIWEVTQACALACVHCRAEARPRRDPRELSTDEGFRLIDEVATFPKALLVLTGGDPMERPDLLELVEHAVRKGIRTALSPSATDKVTLERLQALKNVGLHRVAVSLDGADAATHDAFRGVPGSFQRTMDIAEDLRRIGLPLQIGTTITRRNADQLEALADHVGRLGAVLWSVFFLVPTGRANPDLMLDAAQCEAVLHRLYDISRRVRFAIKTTEAPHYRRVVLQRSAPHRPSLSNINDAKGFVFVSHRGEVYPSGFLPLSAGNIHATPLGTIYRESELFKALRNADELKGKCGRCDYRELCGGSRARAYGVTADPLAEDPLCVYEPASGDGRESWQPLGAVPLQASAAAHGPEIV